MITQFIVIFGMCIAKYSFSLLYALAIPLLAISTIVKYNIVPLYSYNAENKK